MFLNSGGWTLPLPHKRTPLGLSCVGETPRNNTRLKTITYPLKRKLMVGRWNFLWRWPLFKGHANFWEGVKTSSSSSSTPASTKPADLRLGSWHLGCRLRSRMGMVKADGRPRGFVKLCRTPLQALQKWSIWVDLSRKPTSIFGSCDFDTGSDLY